jgi:hypothetical protein
MQAATVNGPAFDRDRGLRMEEISENKQCAVSCKKSKNSSRTVTHLPFKQDLSFSRR